MDISTDEVRRELRDTQREHKASLRPFRDALARAFDRDSGASQRTKHELVGQTPGEGALVLARMPIVVYGAPDPKAGFGGSLGDLLRDGRLNHRCEVRSGVLADASGTLLRGFFRERR